MSGWIKLHRSLKGWEWFDDHNATRLLLYLLISVNYESKKWKGITIQAGSMVFSWQTLSAGCGLSIQQCRTAMQKLIDSEEVTSQSTNKYQLVSLVKWDKLQNDSEEVTSKPTDKEQANNKQITTTKEDKNKRSKESNLKENNKRKFKPPNLEQVKTYCDERKNTIDPQAFLDFYESKGWLIGKNKMKDWKAAVRTWERNQTKQNENTGISNKGARATQIKEVGKFDY